jgi:hypothetical protein
MGMEERQGWASFSSFPSLSHPHTHTLATQAVLKIVTVGFALNGPHSYIRSAWNVLDLFVVVVGVLVLILEAVLNNKQLIWLRAFRALR